MFTNVIFGPEIEIMTFTQGQSFERENKHIKTYNNFKGVRTVTDVGLEVDKKVRAYMFTHNEKDYQSAMAMVFQGDPQLKNQYAGCSMETENFSEYSPGKQTRGQISAEVDRRIKNLMRENSALSYPEAMIIVLKGDAELSKAYTGSYFKPVE